VIALIHDPPAGAVVDSVDGVGGGEVGVDGDVAIGGAVGAVISAIFWRFL
jgi:hypothetical protein